MGLFELGESHVQECDRGHVYFNSLCLACSFDHHYEPNCQHLIRYFYLHGLGDYYEQH